MSSYYHDRSRAFSDDEPVELDGLRTIFDLKVALFPADMQKKPASRLESSRPATAFSRRRLRRKCRQGVRSYGRR